MKEKKFYNSYCIFQFLNTSLATTLQTFKVIPSTTSSQLRAKRPTQDVGLKK